jgi:hypothetical protein
MSRRNVSTAPTSDAGVSVTDVPPPSERLYRTPQTDVDYSLVRQFVLDAESADLFTESLTFEAKEKRDHLNIVEAVASLSNTDGGIVLVGVKDRDASGDARIVGVLQSEHDAIVSQLHSLIPAAMPEVIPVAKPGTDRLVIVLRVDADLVLHPVIVAGKVLYRIPGQKAPADRQRIIDMLARDQQDHPQSGPMQIIQPAWMPREMSLWHDDATAAANSAISGSLRVVGGLTLPQRILDRPWLDTRAKQAAVDALNNSPLRYAPTWSLQPWQLIEARAGSVHFQSHVVSSKPVRAESAAYLRLAGRYLALLVGFRWLKLDDGPFKLSLDSLYDALAASMVTVASTCAHVAKALEADQPTEPRVWESWLSSSDTNVLHVIDLGGFIRDNKDELVGANFPGTRIPSNDVAHLDRVARDWLTYWLLEIGTRGFESWLAEREFPSWVKWPNIA